VVIDMATLDGIFILIAIISILIALGAIFKIFIKSDKKIKETIVANQNTLISAIGVIALFVIFSLTIIY